MSYAPPQQQGYPQPGQPPYPYNNQYPPQSQYPPQTQQQAYYQPGQPTYQGNYGQQTVVQQQVVTVQPAAAFGQVPVHCQCPHCHAVISSQVKREIGNTTFVYCCIMSLFCCCCFPFCMDCAKDAAHFCPNCKKHLATFKQPVVQSGGGTDGRHGYDPTFGGPGDDGTGRGPVDYGGGGGGDGGGGDGGGGGGGDGGGGGGD